MLLILEAPRSLTSERDPYFPAYWQIYRILLPSASIHGMVWDIESIANRSYIYSLTRLEGRGLGACVRLAVR